MKSKDQQRTGDKEIRRINLLNRIWLLKENRGFAAHFKAILKEIRRTMFQQG